MKAYKLQNLAAKIFEDLNQKSASHNYIFFNIIKQF